MIEPPSSPPRGPRHAARADVSSGFGVAAARAKRAEFAPLSVVSRHTFRPRENSTHTSAPESSRKPDLANSILQVSGAAGCSDPGRLFPLPDDRRGLQRAPHDSICGSNGSRIAVRAAVGVVGAARGARAFRTIKFLYSRLVPSRRGAAQRVAVVSLLFQAYRTSLPIQPATFTNPWKGVMRCQEG